MRRKGRVRNPLFAKRWFSNELIIQCVRWYLRFRLSYRDLASIAAELGMGVAPSTILRWTIRYSEEFVRRWDAFELVMARSWRSDETYVKVSRAWMYLYRAVDKQGRAVGFLYLSRTRDRTTAQIFFVRRSGGTGSPAKSRWRECEGNSTSLVPILLRSDPRNI